MPLARTGKLGSSKIPVFLQKALARSLSIGINQKLTLQQPGSVSGHEAVRVNNPRYDCPKLLLRTPKIRSWQLQHVVPHYSTFQTLTLKDAVRQEETIGKSIMLVSSNKFSTLPGEDALFVNPES